MLRKREVLLAFMEEIFRSRGPRVSHGNRGMIYRGVALDKFISISMENTLHTHNAAKPRASILTAINNATWCRMSRMRGGLGAQVRIIYINISIRIKSNI